MRLFCDYYPTHYYINRTAPVAVVQTGRNAVNARSLTMDKHPFEIKPGINQENYIADYGVMAITAGCICLAVDGQVGQPDWKSMGW